MKKNNINKKNVCNCLVDETGVTLIEILIGIGLISVLVLSVYMSLSGAVRNMGDAKQRSGAVALANERMEVLRHMAYADVGTVSGIGPRGPFVNMELIKKNGFTYTLRTDIRYVDDPFDGIGENDPINTDYKQSKVLVSWQNSGKQKTVEFFSNFIPRGVETQVDGGTLSINTTDSTGTLVPNVNVHIASIENDPAVNETYETDASGNLLLPGTPAQSYRITLSKAGYESIRTYPAPPSSAFMPTNTDLIVIESEMNNKTFIIDQAANLEINAVNVADNSGIENMEFSFAGGKLIGTFPDTYSLNETNNTNSSGQIIKSNISPGLYSFLNISTLGNDDFQYIGADTTFPVEIAHGQSKAVHFLFADKSIDSLFVNVLDPTGTMPISGAEVHLVGQGVDQTLITGIAGTAYFPPIADPPIILSEGNYDLTITASGYSSHQEQVNINELVTKTINLE